jgi:hypothetical protein
VIFQIPDHQLPQRGVIINNNDMALKRHAEEHGGRIIKAAGDGH